jgi:large subunit ribosomal protein L1
MLGAARFLGACRLPALRAALLHAPSRAFAAAAAPAPTLSGTAKSKLEKARRLAKRKTAAQLVRVRPGPTFSLAEAVRIVRALGQTSPAVASVSVQVQLGIDPRKTEQAVRGVASLPHGTGKRVVVAVFARGEKAIEARAAGAAIVGDVDLADRIAKGELGFTKAIATPDLMSVVGRVARVLGPRGLMPNPRLGTVTNNIKEAVAAALRGQASFRSDKSGILASACGKADLPEAALAENVRAFISTITTLRPEGFKGTFIRAAFLAPSRGPAIPVDISTLSADSASAWDGAPAHVALPSAAPPQGAAATTERAWGWKALGFWKAAREPTAKSAVATG